MPAGQCLGRLARDAPKGVNRLEFEQGGTFYIPIRCNNIAKNGDLCGPCITKDKKTREGGPRPLVRYNLMGRVTEPIPYWSRLYDGAWYRLKLEEGCTVSKEDMVKAKKAAAVAYEGVQTVEPQPSPVKKAVSAAKKQPNKIPIAEKPIAFIPNPMEQLPVERVIKVRKQEIKGKSRYLGPKDKVYDTDFKYVGRVKGGEIDTSFPDSDEEI